MTTLSRNVVFNVVGQGLALLVSLVAVRFIFRQLGPDVFGIIYFNLTLAALLTTVLELGILATTVREVSSHYSSEPLYIKSLIRTASSIYWGIGLVAVVAVFAAAPLLVHRWINLTTLDAETAATLLRILTIGTMVVLPRALYTSLFRGRQQMAINNAIDVGTAIVQQLGVVVLLGLGSNLYLVAAWLTSCLVLAVLVYIFVAAKLFGWQSLMPGFDSSVIKRNLRFSSLMMSNSLLATGLTSIDKVVVSKLLSVTEFGLYGFASATVGRANMVTAAIGQAALPAFASHFRAGDHDALLRQYRKLQDLVCFGTLPMFAAIAFGALPAYRYLFNSSIASHLLVPTDVLVVGFYMAAVMYVPYIASVAVGKPEIMVRGNSIALLIQIPATVVLVIAYGIVGAAFSWVLYQVFAFLYVAPRISRQALRIEPITWYLHSFTAFGLGLVVYGATLALLALTGHWSLVALTVTFVAASLIYGAAAYRLIGSDTRTTLMRTLNGVLNRMQVTPRRVEHDQTEAMPPFNLQSRSTLVVVATWIGLGLAVGGLAYLHPGWAALAMVALVGIAAAVFVWTLGWTVGLAVLLIATTLIDRWTFRVGGYDLRPEQVAALIAICAVLAQRLQSGRLDWLRPTLAEGLLAAWFAVGLVSSILVAPSRSQSLKVLALLVISSAALVLPRRLIERRRDLDLIVRYLLLALALEGAYALLAYFLHLFGPTISISVNPAGGHLNAYGTLWEPNVLGAICGAGALAWAHLGKNRFRHEWIGIAVCFSACVVSLTRTALLATTAVLVLSLLLPSRQRPSVRAVFLSAIAAVITIGAVIAADAASNYTVAGTAGGGALVSIGNGTDLTGRFNQIKPLLTDLKHSPLIGGGIDSFGQRHIAAGAQEHLANIEMSIVNDTGVLGLMLFAAFIAVILVAAWRNRHDDLVLGLGAMLTVVAITNQATETLELMITWLLVGMLVAAVELAEPLRVVVKSPAFARTAPGTG